LDFNDFPPPVKTGGYKYFAPLEREGGRAQSATISLVPEAWCTRAAQDEVRLGERNPGLRSFPNQEFAAADGVLHLANFTPPIWVEPFFYNCGIILLEIA
jgi:hypothetical protein